MFLCSVCLYIYFILLASITKSMAHFHVDVSSTQSHMILQRRTDINNNLCYPGHFLLFYLLVFYRLQFSVYIVLQCVHFSRLL